MKLDGILDKTLQDLNPEEGTSQELTVNMEMLGVLMNNLTNLYADPKTGAFRETLSNAIDSHVNLAGNTEGFVEVELPNHDKNGSTISIKDYGVGMSRDVLVKNFLSYGSSTKTDSNNETGGFGYGGKSPLAVANTFHVVSVKDGLRNSFSVTKNPEDTLIPPKFDWDTDCFEQPVKSEAPDGVTVTYEIPRTSVRHNYMTQMADWEPTEKLLLGVPQNTVKVDGEVVTKTVHNPELFDPVMFDNEIVGWIAKDKETELDERLLSDRIHVNIGNVIYEVENYSLNSSNIYALQRWEAPVVLNAPTGSLDMTPSRDELRYSERTVKTISAIVDNFLSTVRTEIQTRVNRAENMTEAATIFAEFHDDGFVWEPDSNVTYRDKGEILPALSELSRAFAESLRSKKPFVTSYWATERNGRTKKHQNSYSDNSRWSSILSDMRKYPIYRSNENNVSVGSRVRRNWELLEEFGNQSAKHKTLSAPALNSIVVSNSFISTNRWSEEIFGQAEDFEEALKSARKKRAEYRKKHGIKTTRAARSEGPRPTKIAFVTLSTDPDNESNYLMTSYGSLADGAELGEHYKYIIRDAEQPSYSVSDYDSGNESGPLSGLSDELRLRLAYAEENGFPLVLRTSRQAPVSFEKEIVATHQEVHAFAVSKATPPPVMSDYEVRSRIALGDVKFEKPGLRHRHSDVYRGLINWSMDGYRYRNLRENVEQLAEFATENNITLSERISSFYEAITGAPELISNSEVVAWEKFRADDVFTRRVFAHNYLSDSEYSELHREASKAVVEEMQNLRERYSLLFLAVNLKSGSQTEEEEELLNRQIQALIEVTEQ